MRPRFSIALLHEDGSEPTWRGLKAILEKLLRRFEDNGFTPRVEIGPADPKVRPILIANKWQSPKLDSDKLELVRYLARKVSEPGGFVVFHFDGDYRWRDRMKSDRLARFDREIRDRVRQALAGLKNPTLSRAEIERRVSHLITCVPFYSTEAWMFQATSHAIALCQKKHRGKHVDTFKKWGADRPLLDDELRPKEIGCLGGEHNEELAKHVPVWEVVQAGRSLTYFVWSLHACPELADALAFPA